MRWSEKLPLATGFVVGYWCAMTDGHAHWWSPVLGMGSVVLLWWATDRLFRGRA